MKRKIINLIKNLIKNSYQPRKWRAYKTSMIRIKTHQKRIESYLTRKGWINIVINLMMKCYKIKLYQLITLHHFVNCNKLGERTLLNKNRIVEIIRCRKMNHQTHKLLEERWKWALKEHFLIPGQILCRTIMWRKDKLLSMKIHKLMQTHNKLQMFNFSPLMLLPPA